MLPFLKLNKPAPKTDPVLLAEGQSLIQASAIGHVAIIMDGNRRWAKAKNQPTLTGHYQGVTALRNLVEYASDIGLQAMTVYAFSTENWQRAEEEVGYLMGLFVSALGKYIQELHQNQVRLRFIGDLKALPEKLQSEIAQAHQLTAGNTGLQFQVATNYGSQAELVSAVRQIAVKVAAGELSPEAIQAEHIEEGLCTAGLPKLDLLIRTGGEYRLSNYLLWQAAYAEFYVTQDLWPDFTPQSFNAALNEFIQRERRFGK